MDSMLYLYHGHTHPSVFCDAYLSERDAGHWLKCLKSIITYVIKFKLQVKSK